MLTVYQSRKEAHIHFTAGKPIPMTCAANNVYQFHEFRFLGLSLSIVFITRRLIHDIAAQTIIRIHWPTALCPLHPARYRLT